MTVSTSIVKIQYQDDGTSTEFAVPFPLFTPGNLAVTLFDTVALAAVSPAPMFNGGGTYDYIFTGTLDPGGTGEYLTGGEITFNNAPLANYRVTIKRAEPLIQDLALSNAPFDPPAMEGAGFDNLAMQIQQLAGTIGGAILAPDSDVAPAMVLPPAPVRAGLILGFDANGNVQLYALSADAVVSPVPIPVDANFAVSAFALYWANAGSITGTLSAAPSQYDEFDVVDAAGVAGPGSPITINLNGNTYCGSSVNPAITVAFGKISGKFTGTEWILK